MIMESKFELFRKKAFDLLLQSGISPENIDACNYELILEAGLDGVTDRVLFKVLNFGYRHPDAFITEIRLNMQDIFIFNEWGLFLLNTDGPMDIKFEEHTYPDINFFREKDAAELNIFYNADLSLIINNRIVWPKIRTDIFKQYLSTVDRRNYGATELQEIPKDSGSIIILVGSKNIYFNLDLPRKTKWTDSPLRLRLRLRGLLFRNASIIT